MTKMICTENDADCPSYSNKQCTFDGHCSLKEEENKMKCPKCGEEFMMRDDWIANGKPEHNCATTRPNPSPRDIFQHIKTDCELRGFQKFLFAYSGTVPDRPLENETIKEIKENRPDWYSWLQHKGLVHKEKVKREAWVNVYYGKLSGYEIGHSYISEKEAKENAFDRKDKRHIKTILLHSWEE